MGPARKLSLAERVARVVAMLACLWFALVAVWGMFGPITGGHYASTAATAIMGENIDHWKILGAVWTYTNQPPPPTEYFCHHPLGAFWIDAIILPILGHHDYVARLPAVLMSIATPVLLYKIAKAQWGVIPGATAACGFVVLPICLGFAQFHNLEVQAIFGSLLFFWGQSRFLETYKTRYIAWSALGTLFATSADWPGYLSIGFLLGWGFLHFIVPERLLPRVKLWPYARWWAINVVVAAATLVLWVYLFSKWNKLADWLASGEMRGPQEGVKLAQALETRKFWIEAMFTPLPILIGKLALPFVAIRAIIRRRDGEMYTLAIGFAAAVQYVIFKKGADVHIFWPHYFGAFYALALAQLVATMGGVLTWVLARFKLGVARAIGAWTMLVATLVPTVLVLPDGVRMLRLGRQSGGRYNNNGTVIRTELDMVFMASWLRKHVTREQTIDTNPQIFGWESAWALGQVSLPAYEPPPPGPQNEGHPYWINRGSAITAEQMKKIAKASHLRFYGDVIVVDEREPAGPPDAYAVHEKEPNFFQWCFVSGTDVVRSVDDTPDPFLTWEWRTHLDMPADVPTVEPVGLEQLRVAHNIAVEAGDDARIHTLRDRIDTELDRTVQAKFDQGVSLIGLRFTNGVFPRLEMWFQASEALQSDPIFQVHSIVEGKNPLSLLPADTTERNMMLPPTLPPKLWKPGFIYKNEIELYHRVGKERYWGYWWARAGAAPRRLDGQTKTDLVVLP